MPQYKENTYTFLNNSEILETLEESTELHIKEIDDFFKKMKVALYLIDSMDLK